MNSPDTLLSRDQEVAQAGGGPALPVLHGPAFKEEHGYGYLPNQ